LHLNNNNKELTLHGPIGQSGGNHVSERMERKAERLSRAFDGFQLACHDVVGCVERLTENYFSIGCFVGGVWFGAAQARRVDAPHLQVVR
jgi:hypothetical protein